MDHESSWQRAAGARGEWPPARLELTGADCSTTNTHLPSADKYAGSHSNRNNEPASHGYISVHTGEPATHLSAVRSPLNGRLENGSRKAVG
jgi:hypothetical protein